MRVTLIAAMSIGALAVVIAIALGTGSAAAAPAARELKVASGMFHGVPWTLRARDAKNGSWCMSLTVAGAPSSTCDRLNLSNSRSSINYFGHLGRPGPNYWTGPITSKAKRVVLTYTDGRRISVPAIPAPTGLTRQISFYVFITPCRTPAPKRIVGLDAHGRVVALADTFPQRRARLAC